jgi:hypothetical protein
MRNPMKALLLAVLLWVSSPVSAAPIQEYELKTAFLYNFALFTQWPNETVAEGSPYITVCTIGQDPFGPVLEQLQGRKIREKRLVLRREISLDQVRDCHLLYISANEPENLARIREQLQDASVLTVSDLNPASTERTIVNMSIDNKRLVFDIDMMAVKQARLVMSSKLLRLARRVY